MPYVGLAGVLFAAVISTLSGRVTTFGIADIRGAVHAGVDDGAWITTAFTVAQMLVAFPAVWLSSVIGARRVLLSAGAVYTVACFALPFSRSLGEVLVFQALGGLSSGTFIPLTIGFVLRSLPPKLQPYGVAIYAMNSELSQNIAASLEGWYTDHWSWQWIFWDNALLTPIMMLCVWLGVPREPIRRELWDQADWSGLIYSSVGFALIYAGLDQGNRLDWLGSGVVSGLLLSGGVLVAAFVIQELVCPRPVVALSFMARGNIPLLALLLVAFRFIALSTGYIIPTYLTAVQGYRALEVGSVLIWIALPQFLLAPVSGFMLSRFDARLPLAIGFALIGAACFMATDLTRDWATGDFLPSQVLQAVGQSFALSAIVFFGAQHLRPTDVLSFGALIQTARLLGGELGTALMQTFVRVREQLHSNLLGLHVVVGDDATGARLQAYQSAMAPHSLGTAEATARATGLLSRAVQVEANVLSYIDGFMLAGLTALASLGVMLLLRAAPVRPPPPAAPSNASA
jgi:DHA2 family multidrug resistance protein